jgi:3-deoxy-7-phosphoheptulonate synthase
LTEGDLARAYKSQVDPRLNAEQALELAMLIARRAGAGHRIGKLPRPAK